MRSPAEQHGDNIDAANQRQMRLGEPYQEATAVGASRYSTGRRVAFFQLLDDLESGVFGADELWLWEPSRGSRKVGEWVRLIDTCEAAGVAIWVTTHRKLYDLTNARDRRTLLEDAVDSEYETAKTSERVRRAARARAADGRPHGRQNYGHRRVYDRATRQLLRTEVDPDTAPTVVEIFTRFAAGESVSAIADDLTRRGQLTPAQYARKQKGESLPNVAAWSRASLLAMLANEAYLGHRTSGVGTRVENAWPALVDEVTWRRCKSRLAGRVPGVRYAAKHLLSGLAGCGVPGCGGTMVHNPGTAARPAKTSYMCEARHHNSRKAGRWTPDPGQCDGLEGLVVEYVLALWDGTELDPGDDPRIDALDAQLSAMRAELGEWHASIGPGGPSPGAVAAAEARLEPAIAEAERELGALLSRGVLPDLDGRSLRAAWPTLALAVRRSIIAQSVQIIVLPVGKGKRFDPASVEIKPRW